MTTRLGRRTPAVLTTLALAAAVGAAPAPAAETGHNHADLAACNALLPDSAVGIGSLDAARTAAARGGIVREPVIDATDIEIPAGSVPKVGKRFSATIPVYFHVINKGPTLADGNVPQSQVQAQIDVLNQTFAGARGGANTGFKFQLVKTTRTTNAEWFEMAHSRVEREAKYALHEGGMNALNIYSNSGAGYLGFAYYPKDVRGRPEIDGVVMAFDSMPGGTIKNYNLGFTAYARGRPLAGRGAHVPERLLDHGRPHRRHAGGALPDHGLPDRTGHVHGSGRGPDPQLHGLLLRRLLHGVHRRSGEAHGRAVALLQGAVGRSGQRLVLALVLARELLEQLEGGGLGGRGRHLAAAEVLELRVEARMHGDLVAAGVLEHDRGAAAGLALGEAGAARGARGGQHGHRELAPVADGIGLLDLVHVGEMVLVALREGGDGGLEGSLAQ